MNKLNKKVLVIASILGAITIAIGAFGAHGLKTMVGTEAIQSFETGVRYQMYHVIALLVIGFSKVLPEATLKWVFRFFLFGMILFSGSIYLLAMKDYVPFPAKILGPITPLGGLLFIVGWLRMGYGIFTLK